jgi:hypothetical protein
MGLFDWFSSRNFVRYTLRTALALGALGLIVVVLMPVQALAAAGTNQQINFQGRLLTNSGAVVPDGNYNMEFKIYQDGPGNVAADTGGSLKWTEDYQNNTSSEGVAVINGYFSVSLSTYCSFTGAACTGGQSQSNAGVDFNQDTLWLSINVGGITTGSPTYDGEMLPMKRLASAVYALQARSCTSCILQAPTSTAQNTIQPATSGVVGLTVNATNAGTAAQSLVVNQATAADGQDINVSNGSGTAGAGLAVTKTGAGTLTSGISVTRSAGTLTYGLNLSGTISTDIRLQNAETIDNATDGTVNVAADSGAVTLKLTGTAANLQNSAGNLGITAASALNLASTGANNIVLTTANASAGTVLQTSTNSTTAFQVLNASSASILNVDTATTSNLVTNGGFESGVSGWSAKGSAGAPAQTNAQQWQGNNSLSETTTAAIGDGVKYAYTFTNAQQYTLSFYLKLSSGSWTNANLAAGRADDGSTDTACTLAPTSAVSTANWIRYSCTFTASAQSGTPYIFIKQLDATARTFFLDGVQLQTGASATPFNAGGVIQLNGVVNSPVAFQNKSDSTTALQVQNAAGTSNVLVVDTVNGTVGIDQAPGTGNALTVSGTTQASNFLISGSVSGNNIQKNYAAGTGGVAQHDVVVLANDSGTNDVIDSTTTEDTRVFGVANVAAAATVTTQVVISGNTIVNADATAVAIGDQLVVSSTSGKVTVDNSATTGILGIATGTKGSGAGTVNVFVRPVNGVTNPNYAGNVTIQGSSALTLGSTSNNGKLNFLDGTSDGFTGSVQLSGAIGSNQTYSLPTTGGTFCLTTQNCNGAGTGYIVNGTSTQTGNFNIQSAAASSIGAAIQGASNQTADLLNLRDSTGYTMDSVDAAGNFQATGTGGLGKFNNFLEYSEQFNQGIWTKTTASATADQTSSPDGTTDADTVHASSSGGSITQSYTSAGNNTYTFSVWLKTGSGTQNVDLRIDSNGTPATGTAKTVTATTNWQRFWVTQTFTSGVSSITATIFPGTASGTDSVTEFAWGAQLVQDSVPENYLRSAGSVLPISTAGQFGQGLVLNPTANAVGLEIQQAASQSAWLLQVDNSSDLRFAGIDGSGNLVSGNTVKTVDRSCSSCNSTQLIVTSGSATGTTSSSGSLSVTTGSGTTGVGSITVQPGDTTSSDTAAAGSLTLQGGNNAEASSTGGSVTIQGGSDTGATSASGGNVSVFGGNASTGTTTTGGNVTIDAGTGTTSNGSVSIGTSSATGVTLGKSGSTFTVNSAATINNTAYVNTNSSTALKVEQNGTHNNVLVVDTASGAVGINKTPGIQLDVGGTSGATNGFLINTGSASNGFLAHQATVGAAGVSIHDVVILDSSVLASDTTTARDPRVYGVAEATGTSGNGVNVTIAGNDTVNADTVAVNIGDQLVTSTTSGKVTVDNSATTGILGIALSSKAGGSSGTVSVEVNPVHGQYTPTFRPSSDSVTALQLQTASGTSYLTGDSKNLIVSTKDVNVGTAATSSGKRVFSDGFESGTFGLYATQVGGGNASIDTANVRNGKYAAKFTPSGSTAYVRTPVTGSTTMSMRGYVYITSQTSGNEHLMALCVDSGCATDFLLYRDVSTGFLQFWNGATSSAVGSPSTIITTGAWHEIEADFTINASTGTVNMYLDGTNILTASSLNTGSSIPAYVNLGEDASGRTSVAALDDVVIDNGTTATGNSSSLNVNDSLHVSGSSSFGSNLVIQPGSDSTNAFQVQNASGVSLLTVDTSTPGVSIGATGSSTLASTIHIADTSNGTGIQGVAIGSNANASSSVTIDSGTGASAIQIGNSATAHGIKIGTGAAAQTLALGSLTTTSATAIQAGTGNLTLATGNNGSGTAGNITLTTGTSTSGNAAVIAKSGTNSTGAFQVQDSSSAAILNVDTSAAKVTVATTANGGTFINNGAMLNTAKALSDFSTNQAIGTAAATVDKYTTFTINQNVTAGITLTVPSPTDTTAGRILYISNIGTQTLILGGGIGITLSAGSNASLLWNGTAWTSTAVSTGASVVGTYSSSNHYNDGASITGNTLTLGSADATHPGLIDTGAQTFAGDKTFKSSSNSASALRVQNSDGESVFQTGTSQTVNGITNYIADSEFALGSGSCPLTDWAVVGSPTTCQQDTTAANNYTGDSSSLKLVTTTSAGQGITTSSFTSSPVTATSGAGQFYTVSFYAMQTGGTTLLTGANFTAVATGGGSPSNTCTIDGSATNTLITTGFKRVVCTLTFTANSTISALAIQTSGTISTADTIYLSDVQLQQAGSAAGTLSAPVIGQLQLRGVVTTPVAMQNTANSGTAFQIQNAAGTSLVNVNSNNVNLSSTVTSAAALNTVNSARESSVLTSTNIATPSATSYVWTNGVSPHTVGNVMVLAIGINSTTFSVSSVTGGGVTTWTKINANNLSATNRVELWYGTATTVGTASVTINFAGGTVNVATEEINQEFTANLGSSTNWSVTTSGVASNGAASNITFPSLTSGSAPGGLYVGYGAESSGNASSGTTSGFTFEPTPVDLDMYLYNPSLAASTTYQPVSGLSASATSNVVAAILTASADNTFSVNGATTIGGAASQTAFQVQNASGNPLFNVNSADNIVSLEGGYTGTISSWQPNSNSMPNIMGTGGAVAANGYIFNASGNDNSTVDGKVFSAKVNSDGTVGAWTQLSSIPGTPVKFHGTVATNGYMYELGGTNNSGTDQNTVQFAQIKPDGTLGSWSTTTVLPQTVSRATAVAANGYIYVLGGVQGGSNGSVVYYGKVNADGTISSWSTGGALTAVSRDLQAVYANGYIIVAGGGDGTNAQTTVQTSAVPAAGGANAAFSTAGDAALPAGKAQASMAVANGVVYVVGGRTTDNSNSPVGTSYYGQLNSSGQIAAWSTTPSTYSLPIQVFGQSMVNVNGYLIVMGGLNLSGALVSNVASASTARIAVNASLDLVGSSWGSLADGGDQSLGSSGGTLTAGNTNIVGSLQVANQANFSQNASVSGNLSIFGQTLLKTNTNSTTAFQLQNSSGADLLNADTSTQGLTVNSSAITATLSVRADATQSSTANGVFTSAGSSTFTVPNDVTSITATVWGAGGGGGAGNGTNAGGNGGGGGFVKTAIPVVPGETLTTKVGSGGGVAGGSKQAGGGGGYTEILRGSTVLAVAGAGGGGGGNVGAGTVTHGGAGGGYTTAATAGTSGTGGGGGAATSSGGGTAGAAGDAQGAGVAGASLAGGNGGGYASSSPVCTSSSGTGGNGGTGAGGGGGNTTTNCEGGGGGGGGYFGGGGGGAAGNTTAHTGGGGGGGFGYTSGSQLGDAAGSTGATPNAGGTGDSTYSSCSSNAGKGGSGNASSASASAGNPGCIVVTYTTATNHTSAFNVETSGGTDVLRVAANGTTLFKNSSDSTVALQVQNSSGSQVFDVDTSNQKTIARQNSSGGYNPVFSLQQAGSGDATMEIQDASTSFFVGVDNSNNHSFNISSAGAAATSDILGQNYAISSPNSADGNGTYAQGTRFVATSSGTLSSISVAFDSGSGNYSLALYADDGTDTVDCGKNGTASCPHTLLAKHAGTSAVSITSSGSVNWNTQTLDTCVVTCNVTAGTAYWLVVQTDASGAVFKIVRPSSTYTSYRNMCNTVGCGGSGSGALNIGSWGNYSTMGGTNAVDGNGTDEIGIYATIAASATDTFNNTLFNLSTTGATTIRNTTNSSSAFMIQNAGSQSMFSVDTTNSRVYIGTSSNDTLPAILVMHNYNASTDPTGTNGAIYYNSGGVGGANSADVTHNGKFRCYEEQYWKNCIGMRDIEERRWGYLAPTSLTATSLSAFGIMTAPTPSGGAADKTNAESYYPKFTTAASTGTSAGEDFNVANTEGQWGPKVVTRVRVDGSDVSQTRDWVGMVSTSEKASNGTGSYAAIRYSNGTGGSGDTDWMCATNGGGTNDTGIPVTAGHYYDMIIDMSLKTVVICSVSEDGGAFTTVHINTTPTATTDLGLEATVTTLNGTAKSLEVAYMFLEQN